MSRSLLNVTEKKKNSDEEREKQSLYQEDKRTSVARVGMRQCWLSRFSLAVFFLFKIFVKNLFWAKRKLLLCQKKSWYFCFRRVSKYSKKNTTLAYNSFETTENKKYDQVRPGSLLLGSKISGITRDAPMLAQKKKVPKFANKKRPTGQ